LGSIKIDAASSSRNAIIVRIKAKEPVKGRLFSLGLSKGSELKVLDHTLAKQTWEVESDGTKIALREEEAASIFIEPKGCEA